MKAKDRKSTNVEAEDAVIEIMRQKKALAEAIRELGVNASHSAIARFMKQRFDVKLTFGLAVPKGAGTRKTVRAK